MTLIISLFLIVCSAIFSGLTLAYFSLDLASLRRRANTGDPQAIAIYPLRARGNLLLTTLLLGNVTVNTILSVFLGSLASGVMASFMATALIFIFGEIGPQALFSRHALKFGSALAPLTRALMFIGYPVAFPVAYTLDRLLGHATPAMYSKHEIMQIISEHEDSEHSPIDADEERIVHGALQFSHRQVREVMTPIENVAMFDENQRLNDQFFNEVSEQGYSRFPIYSGNKTNVVGVLFAKDLLTEDENISIKQTEEAFDTNIMRLKGSAYLDTVLARMLKKKQHIAIVEKSSGEAIGVLSLEDIIEEIIQSEIEDEEDAQDEENMA
ncbi:CNNM domain-containing protein [Patescibacteria group bacterium]|nr:CNNM domain-containing protein [Patescibacteria group bacterium]